MNLLFDLPIPQMLAGQKAIVKKIEAQEFENVMFTQVDIEKVQRPAHTIILQEILSLFSGKNILKNHKTFRRK